MRQERFYLVVGLSGVAAVILHWLLRRATMAPATQLVSLVSALVIIVWAVAGVVGARRAAREEQKRVAEAQRAAALHRAAQEAAECAARQVNARRTVSHGGMSIDVRRRPPREGS